jgi:hypothetical protein
MTRDEPLPVRRAALLLHGLSPGARRDVMRGLTREESARLEPLLFELSRMGVPSTLGAALSEGAAPKPAAPMSAVTPQESIEQLSAQCVAACTESCSATTVAHILRAADWSWKAQLLGLLSERRRAEVQSKVLTQSTLDVLYERLCREASALSERRRSVDSAVASAPRASPAKRDRLATPFARLTRWMR